MPRHLDQRMHELLLVALGEHAAGAAGRDRERGEHRKLAGERLGRGDADLRPGQRRHHDVALAGIVEVGTLTTDSTCCLCSRA